ncbi:Hypothetical protein FKW44_021936 [Caligus rogercresseyi]|uniref:Uncharacterized protein n=1 Tax=Caligus rogercresseyi TaxID=217165 RepID=A0A7T8JWS2_CALRO|nr:Hypothetical protein FKW44_021936 [Caligus rogercresseyi]
MGGYYSPYSGFTAAQMAALKYGSYMSLYNPGEAPEDKAASVSYEEKVQSSSKQAYSAEAISRSYFSQEEKDEESKSSAGGSATPGPAAEEYAQQALTAYYQSQSGSYGSSPSVIGHPSAHPPPPPHHPYIHPQTMAHHHPGHAPYHPHSQPPTSSAGETAYQTQGSPSGAEEYRKPLSVLF